MFELEAQLRAYGLVLDRAEVGVTDVVEPVPNRMRRSYVVAIAAAVVVALAVSAIAVGTRHTGGSRVPNVVTPGSTAPISTPTSVPALAPGVLAIGDSVMEGAERSIEALPGLSKVSVDAVKSRQFQQGELVLEQYAALKALPGTVVVALGTNGRVSPAVLDQMMRTVGDRQVFFVTVRVPRPWESEVNTSLRAMPSRWPNAHVIEWHDFANSHNDWFVNDGFHLTAAGQLAYAQLIGASVLLEPFHEWAGGSDAPSAQP